MTSKDELSAVKTMKTRELVANIEDCSEFVQVGVRELLRRLERAEDRARGIKDGEDVSEDSTG